MTAPLRTTARSGLVKRLLLAVVSAFAAMTTLAGCAADTQPPADTRPPAGPPSPFANCAALTVDAGAASASPPSAGPATGGSTRTLPDLALPCFTGGQRVRLADVRGPAVINLWASWCQPCRTELPAMQRLADRAGDRLRVVGVDTGDGRDAAASFGVDTGVALPTLYDRDKTLMNALGRTALPVTVFVDAAGRAYVYNQVALDDAALARLVREHTGVTVPG
jgi:cytochrome c biogenesis protein CcmG, thiol:disulfide interchange protein DsbE